LNTGALIANELLQAIDVGAGGSGDFERCRIAFYKTPKCTICVVRHGLSGVAVNIVVRL
jgi:hypothetical protein